MDINDLIDRDNGSICQEQMAFIFQNFFHPTGGCLIGTTGFLCIRDKKGNGDLRLVLKMLLEEGQLFIQFCFHGPSTSPTSPWSTVSFI